MTNNHSWITERGVVVMREGFQGRLEDTQKDLQIVERLYTVFESLDFWNGETSGTPLTHGQKERAAELLREALRLEQGSLEDRIASFEGSLAELNGTGERAGASPARMGRPQLLVKFQKDIAQILATLSILSDQSPDLLALIEQEYVVAQRLTASNDSGVGSMVRSLSRVMKHIMEQADAND